MESDVTLTFDVVLDDVLDAADVAWRQLHVSDASVHVDADPNESDTNKILRFVSMAILAKFQFCRDALRFSHALLESQCVKFVLCGTVRCRSHVTSFRTGHVWSSDGVLVAWCLLC